MASPTLNDTTAQYPAEVTLNSDHFAVRLMTVDDGPALMSFAKQLPPHDTLYMRRNLTSQAGIESWIEDIDNHVIYSLLAEDSDGVAGFSTIHRNTLEWTRHVADIRVATAPRARRTGLGRYLVREGFNLALSLGVERLLARMTPDQEGARVLFEELGFTPEALLKDYVKDRDGNYHDMLIKACAVDSFLAQRQAFGVD